MKIHELIKNTNIIRVNLHETLSSAISKLNSSHDAAFVFGEGEKYMGVINPYYSLMKSSSPANSRVEHCLFHAPHIKTNFSVAKVATLMRESKVHYLPVFNDQDKLEGIISARRLLSALKGSPVFKIKIKDVLKTKKYPLVTVYYDDTVSVAISELKKYKISKLVVIGKDMKLKGVITYYDLISHLITPKIKEGRGERQGNKISLNYQPISNFAKTLILTLTQEDSMEEAMCLILEKKIGSVVIVDKDRHPTGIITTKDFLNLIAQGNHEKVLEVISKDLSQENRQILGGFFNHLNLWVKKLPNINNARLLIKQEKQGGVFKAILSLFPKKGQPTVIKEEGKNLVKILNKIKKD